MKPYCHVGGEGGEEAAAGATPSSGAEAGTSAEGGNKAAASAAAADSAEPMDEDELLQQALAMSMAVDVTPTGADAATSGECSAARDDSKQCWVAGGGKPFVLWGEMGMNCSMT